MDGKIPLLTYEVSPDQFKKLTSGMEKMNLPFIPCNSTNAIDMPLVEAFQINICVAAGIDAYEMAEREGFKTIHAIPPVELWIPPHKNYHGLGTLIAEELEKIGRRYVGSSSTSASIPTTSMQSTPSVEDTDAPNINPREAGLPFPTDKLSMEEIKSLFTGKYSQDEPFIFSTGGAEVAIYPDKPTGIRPIEFSLDEFYTILKLLEITKADGIVWREREDANPK